MAEGGPLDVAPLWLVFLLTIAWVLLSIEAGFRLGRRRSTVVDVEKESPVGAMVGASLGLLAFLLAFTFGFAASRFETRRTILLEEVNAIGTAYLRTATIPEPTRTESRGLWREYAEARLRGANPAHTEAAIRRSVELQGELWRRAAALAETSPGSIVVGLYLQSLNAVIDLHTKRVTESLRVRVPAVIWLALYAITALAMAELGYQTGLSGRRRPLSIPALALSFAAVILLIADLDRPATGMVRVSQQAMVELLDSMAQ